MEGVEEGRRRCGWRGERAAGVGKGQPSRVSVSLFSGDVGLFSGDVGLFSRNWEAFCAPVDGQPPLVGDGREEVPVGKRGGGRGV